MSLAAILKGKQKKPRVTVIHGGPGVGKSTWAAGAESPIFVPTEDGNADIDVDSFPAAKSVEEFEANLRVLATEEHGYKTVVVDSVDWLSKLHKEKLLRDKGWANMEALDYGKCYAAWDESFAGSIAKLQFLNEKMGLAIVAIAHSEVVKVNDPRAPQFEKYQVALRKSQCKLVTEWASEVLFATTDIYTQSEKIGDDEKRNTGVGTGKRILYTEDRPAFFAKNRLSLPYEMPLEFAAYSAHFPK